MIYAITFRFAYQGDYDDRYNSATAAIQSLAEGGPNWWAEPTSFYLLKSSLGSAQLADEIIAKSKFDASIDLLVVINLSVTKGHAVRGHYDDKDVLKLLGERSK